MPIKPKRGCRKPGCRNLTSSGAYCDEHRKEHNKSIAKPVEFRRLYASNLWQTMRINQLREYPICQECGRTDSLEVHHVIDHKGNPYLFYDQNNLMTLCKFCHSGKTIKRIMEKKW